MNIGKRIIEIRKDNNLSQEQFAEMFYVTRQTVSNWENCKSYPDIETIVKISDTFDVSLDILLKQDKKLIKDIDHKITNVNNINNEVDSFLSKIIMYFRIPIVGILITIIMIKLFPNITNTGWLKEANITINTNSLFIVLVFLFLLLIIVKEFNLKNKLSYSDIILALFFNKRKKENDLTVNNIMFFITIMFALFIVPYINKLLLSIPGKYALGIGIGLLILLLIILPISYIVYQKIILKNKNTVKEIFFDAIFEEDEEIKKESK